MRLSWSEIRGRAALFARRHKEARYEKGETQTFYNEFFDCFGVDRKQVGVYEQRVKNLPDDKQGYIDLFWPGTLLVEQKSAGRDLRRANDQALNYFEGLAESQRPRFILTCDFQNWHLVDLEEGTSSQFKLSDLKDNVEAFSFILGIQPRLFREQSPANEKASRLMGELHEALAKTGYGGHDLEVLLVRLLFILFADDTRIFNNKDQFLDLLERRTQPNGSDLGRWLSELFDVLNTSENDRQETLDQDLASFPYINGDLFAERIRMPSFNKAMRTILLNACLFDWGEVSPAIFGSLFESVIDKVTQRQQGAHYTPETAILRLIGPLFLDGLKTEFSRIKKLTRGRAEALSKFHEYLAELKFLDPACGAGNFLVITYRELRELEREVIKERYTRKGLHPTKYDIDVGRLSKLNVDSFYGIEIEEFPARIAEVALWMTDHIANTRLAEDFGQSYARIPLIAAPNIHCQDALEFDWNNALPVDECSFILGNPPFAGSKFQSDEQRAQVRRIAKLGGAGGTLDYVAAWFIKAAAYVSGTGSAVAFVATNSICQGEQVAQLWPILFHRHKMEIAFAHRTFAWPGRAGVHCVIVGLMAAGKEPAEKRLFSYADGKGQPIETKSKALTAYLFDAKVADRHLVVKEVGRPINGAPRIVSGTQPIDDGEYIFDKAERTQLLRSEPAAKPLLRPYIGTEEYLYGSERWILALQDASPRLLRQLPTVRERMQLVRAFRKKSKRAQTREIADDPTAYNVTVLPKTSFLVIPEVSSERRDYVPIGWLDPPIIPSNKLRLLLDASYWQFAVLTSAMHMAWLKDIGGRLESRYQYGIGVVYNTFPWPRASAQQRADIEKLGKAVLTARNLPKNKGSSLADLYDPDTMPTELRKAHRALDVAVDKLYSTRGFKDDRSRVEHLFKLYEVMVTPTVAAATRNRRTVRRVANKAAKGRGPSRE